MQDKKVLGYLKVSDESFLDYYFDSLFNNTKFVKKYKTQIAVNASFFDYNNGNGFDPATGKGTLRARGFTASEGSPYQYYLKSDVHKATIGFTQKNEFLFGTTRQNDMYSAVSGSTYLVKNGKQG